jgi:predicted metallopeptidase
MAQSPELEAKNNMRRLKLEWKEDITIKKDIKIILGVLDLSHIDSSRIFCYKTTGSKSRAYARIWSMPKIFQHALKIKPAYVIEVLSKYYDKLNEDEKKKVLIHELLHIPKNFSGSLLPHRTHHRHLQSEVNKLFKQYKLNASR